MVPALVDEFNHGTGNVPLESGSSALVPQHPHQLDETLVPERDPVFQHFKQHDSLAVHIGLEVVCFAAQDFGCHPVGGAHAHNVVVLVEFFELAVAEVCDSQLVVAVEKDVAALHVAVHDAA